MDHGPWTMVHGPWSMVHGPPWTMVHGPWTMVHGPGTMVHGPWSVDLRRLFAKQHRRQHIASTMGGGGEGGAGTAKVRRKFTTDNITGTYRGGREGEGGGFSNIGICFNKKTLPILAGGEHASYNVVITREQL